MADRKIEKATFGAGCFWGVESLFRKVPGVIDVKVGYTGGTKENPTYEEVCDTETGHAEAVEVTYDSEEVSYERLLEVFWNNHNPTLDASRVRGQATPNQQPARNASEASSRNDADGGPDRGTQYRSVIFYHSPEQERAAEKSKQALVESEKWPKSIVTQIVPAKTFYPAEEYHQRYFEKQGLEPACHL